MTVDVVMITNGIRRQLLHQSITNLYSNCSNVKSINSFVLVHDNDFWMIHEFIPNESVEILMDKCVGASRCRNIGASSIPKYRRGEYLMFLDDDVYMCPGWDRELLKRLEGTSRWVMSGHSHPYNKHTRPCIPMGNVSWTNVLSTVHYIMPWEIWDRVGYFTEPGGPGGSEDVDWCRRAEKSGFLFGVIEPECIIHTGIRNSKGESIVGAELVEAKNKDLERIWEIEGKVAYS